MASIDKRGQNWWVKFHHRVHLQPRPGHRPGPILGLHGNSLYGRITHYVDSHWNDRRRHGRDRQHG